LDIYNSKHKHETITKEGLFRLMNNNLDRCTVRNWKSGKVPKGFNKVYEIAEILEVEIDDFLTIEEL